jgi:protein-disulfide isomerase
VCAEEQGKLGPMDDALFHNQKEKRPVGALARDVGLDLARFDECLRAPSTRRRVEADVANGIAVGVRATPTYVVNGVPLAGGSLTLQDLPAPPGGQPAASR